MAVLRIPQEIAVVRLARFLLGTGLKLQIRNILPLRRSRTPLVRSGRRTETSPGWQTVSEGEITLFQLRINVSFISHTQAKGRFTSQICTVVKKAS